MAHFWQEWNQKYFDADFPRLMVRNEDVVFRPKAVVKEVCDCIGGTMTEKFDFQVEGTKRNDMYHSTTSQPATDWIGAITKYGHDKHRFDGFKEEDLKLADSVFDPEMMETFHYKFWTDA